MMKKIHPVAPSPREISHKEDELGKIDGLAYSMAMILNVEKDDLMLHRRILRALIGAGLKIGILEKTPETGNKIVVLIDANGVMMGDEEARDKARTSLCSPTSLGLMNVSKSLRKNVHGTSELLREEQVRAKSALVNAVTKLSTKMLREHEMDEEDHENGHSEKRLTASEEVILTNRIILRALNQINVDENGVLCDFDILHGGERSTPIENTIMDIFPLQDEVWNEAFMNQLRARRNHKAFTKGWFLHFWNTWIVQTPDLVHVDKLRVQFGDRISVYLEFVLFYRRWLLYLTLGCCLNYFLVRFSNWSVYLITLGMAGVFITCVWGPMFARRWTRYFITKAQEWKKEHILIPVTHVPNPHIQRDMLDWETPWRRRRRTLVNVVTALVVLVNILLLAPVSLVFTQWYVYGKMAPTCECCQFLLFETGIGNGTQRIDEVPKEMWPEECFEEYVSQYSKYPLNLEAAPESCSMWSTCFANENSTVGTDRWLYILIQGIAMGLILDVLQTAAFKKLTFWLTYLEGHDSLENFTKFLIRKQFFFIWINMFFWYLTITFIYVPFGENVQQWLIDNEHEWIVPPWGWRPNKIRLDEAFVTPMVATATINTIIDTFVPSLLAKLALKAKNRRRLTLNRTLGVSNIAYAAQLAQNLKNQFHGFFEDDEAGSEDSPRQNSSPSKEAEQQQQQQQQNENNDAPPPPSSPSSDDEIVTKETIRALETHSLASLPFSLFRQLEDSLNDVKGVDSSLHFYNKSPDSNAYDATEILTQAVLPKYDENEEYLTLVMQLGYICMFSSAWGLLPLAASIRLLFSFRGSCYKILYASKRTTPLGTLNDPGEWLTAIYLTFLLGIPVVAAQFAISTGGLDTLYRWFGIGSNCGAVNDEENYMIPDFDDCQVLHFSARSMFAFFMEHMCFGLFALIYLHKDYQIVDGSSKTQHEDKRERRGAVAEGEFPDCDYLTSRQVNIISNFFETYATSDGRVVSCEQARNMVQDLIAHRNKKRTVLNPSKQESVDVEDTWTAFIRYFREPRKLLDEKTFQITRSKFLLAFDQIKKEDLVLRQTLLHPMLLIQRERQRNTTK